MLSGIAGMSAVVYGGGEVPTDTTNHTAQHDSTQGARG